MSPDFKPTPRECSITDALAVLGDRYSLAIVRELFYGNRRFVDLIAQLAAPRSLLASRLSTLVEVGVIERRQYSQRPPRDEYVLTAAGRDLMPVLLALKEWGDNWCRGGEQTAIFRHDCGAELHAVATCASCGAEIEFENLEVIGGTNPPDIHL
ncbi:DNA-binding HxlR family transcriptional regulator [Psychromicrobium silvestre]|uniref:DNA-binding HxlR family transcriptional regulator n=1 Tax=Psychromicrobium silvestre TaxID=1645614 RepID=A0A7Y9LVJ5_9MICC|nr:helix-turn-helix domain-containing protein [Psychromicrobium silvestre]NYE96356.1 DNA-binding HxlR family transcriptional regulator [Psychromicrobium silvestre]